MITETDCRSPEGITVGLIDGIIAMSRIVREREDKGVSTEAVKQALEDLRQDSDVRWLAGID